MNEALRTCLAHLRRTLEFHPLSLVVSGLVLCGTFSAVGMVLSLWHTTSVATLNWESRQSAMVYLDSEATPAEVESVIQKIQNHQIVARTDLQKGTQTAKHVQAQMGWLPGSTGSEADLAGLLPDTIEVFIRQDFRGKKLQKEIESFVASTQQLTGVDEVSFAATWVEQLQKVFQIVIQVGLSLVVLLLVCSLIVICFLTASSVEARRHELDTMAVFGATPLQLRLPFVVESTLICAVAGALAVATSQGLLDYWFSLLQDYAPFATPLEGFPRPSAVSLLVLWAMAPLLGALASFGYLVYSQNKINRSITAGRGSSIGAARITAVLLVPGSIMMMVALLEPPMAVAATNASSEFSRSSTSATSNESDFSLVKLRELQESALENDVLTRQIMGSLFEINTAMEKSHRRSNELAEQTQLLQAERELNLNEMNQISSRLESQRRELFRLQFNQSKKLPQSWFGLLLQSENIVRVERNHRAAQAFWSHQQSQVLQLQQDLAGFQRLEAELKQKEKNLERLLKAQQVEESKLEYQTEQKRRALTLARTQRDRTVAELQQLRQGNPTQGLGGPSWMEPMFFEHKGLLSPPIEGKVVRPFGPARVSPHSVVFFHKGIRLQANQSHAEVRSIFSGRVVWLGNVPRLGTTLVVDHGDQYFGVYGNVTPLDGITTGSEILMGQPIATARPFTSLASSQEPAKRAQLHFEIRHFAQPINPLPWFKEASL